MTTDRDLMREFAARVGVELFDWQLDVLEYLYTRDTDDATGAEHRAPSGAHITLDKEGNATYHDDRTPSGWVNLDYRRPAPTWESISPGDGVRIRYRGYHMNALVDSEGDLKVAGLGAGSGYIFRPDSGVAFLAWLTPDRTI